MFCHMYSLVTGPWFE